jgi:hypothetical protein
MIGIASTKNCIIYFVDTVHLPSGHLLVVWRQSLEHGSASLNPRRVCTALVSLDRNHNAVSSCTVGEEPRQDALH